LLITPFNIIQQPSNSVQQNRMDVEAMLKPFARALSTSFADHLGEKDIHFREV